MTDTKISQLTEDTSPTIDDLIVTVNDPAGTPVTKKVTIGSLTRLSQGWIPVSETWTYASASTITIPTDGTTKYQKGMAIRFKQGGGYKYYNAQAVTATLLTVFVNTDYTVANSAITDIAYSFNIKPYGFPAFFNYTSTYSRITTNYTNLPTANTSRYKVINDTVFVQQRYQQHATPGGSGQQRFTLPVAASLTCGIYAHSEVPANFVGFISSSNCTLYKYDGSAEATGSGYYGAYGIYSY